MNAIQKEYLKELNIVLDDTYGDLAEAVLRLPGYTLEELECTVAEFEALQQTALKDWGDYDPTEKDFDCRYRLEMFAAGREHLRVW